MGLIKLFITIAVNIEFILIGIVGICVYLVYYPITWDIKAPDFQKFEVTYSL